MTDSGTTTRVVVVGGGFAGVASARALAKHDDMDVTLIDKNDYHQFQPLLYQVATSMLAAGDIAYPIRRIAAEYDGFTARRGEVTSIDPVARTVTTAYGAAKGGVRMLSRTAGVELAPNGITVVGVAPGAVHTPIDEVTLNDPVARARLESAIPLGRVAEPEEIARLVAFLASDGASYGTATTYAVDGGMMQASVGP
jgi:NAD(P)-dependent dehydrogenase (short-subunit alcohol dehydrogenase family)